jgi:hypothetical protein
MVNTEQRGGMRKSKGIVGNFNVQTLCETGRKREGVGRKGDGMEGKGVWSGRGKGGGGEERVQGQSV